MGAEAVQRAVFQAERHHAAAGAVLHDQVEGEILDEELGRVLERLAVERVQHGMAGAVGRRAGALRGALAEMGGHAAERALIDLAFLGAREGHAVVLELVDRVRRLAAQIFDGVLVAQPVRPLDGVVHVPAPVVLAHVAERGGDAALGRNGVRAGGEDLGDAGGLQAGLAGAERGAQAGAAGADDHHVVGVVDERIGPAVHGRRTVAAVSHGAAASESEGDDGDQPDRGDREGEERVGDDAQHLQRARPGCSPR